MTFSPLISNRRGPICGAFYRLTQGLMILAFSLLGTANTALAGGECAGFCAGITDANEHYACIVACVACKPNMMAGSSSCFCKDAGGLGFVDIDNYCKKPVPVAVGMPMPVNPSGGGGGIPPVEPPSPTNPNPQRTICVPKPVAPLSEVCAALWAIVEAAPTEQARADAMANYDAAGCPAAEANSFNGDNGLGGCLDILI